MVEAGGPATTGTLWVPPLLEPKESVLTELGLNPVKTPINENEPVPGGAEGRIEQVATSPTIAHDPRTKPVPSVLTTFTF